MHAVFWVAVGGAMGAVARYGVGLLLGPSSGHEPAGPVHFPWATLCVNVLGCAAIGALLGVGGAREWLTSPMRLLWVTGFLGAFTTFSTFGYETLRLVDRGQGGMALLYVAGSLLLSAFALLATAAAVKALT